MATEQNKAPKAQEAKSHIVTRRFQDAPQYRINDVAEQYEVGEDVSHLSPERLKVLSERGWVKSSQNEVEATPPPLVTDPTNTNK